jgi:hypothetical protein
MSAEKPTLVEQTRHTGITIPELRKRKSEEVVRRFGYQDDRDGFLKDYALEAVAPGICTHPSCDFTGEVEPDARDNWCESCKCWSVVSALVLMGLFD